MATERAPLNKWGIRSRPRRGLLPQSFRRPYGRETIARDEFFGAQAPIPQETIPQFAFFDTQDAREDGHGAWEFLSFVFEDAPPPPLPDYIPAWVEHFADFVEHDDATSVMEPIAATFGLEMQPVVVLPDEWSAIEPWEEGVSVEPIAATFGLETQPIVVLPDESSAVEPGDEGVSVEPIAATFGLEVNIVPILDAQWEVEVDTLHVETSGVIEEPPMVTIEEGDRSPYFLVTTGRLMT